LFVFLFLNLWSWLVAVKRFVVLRFADQDERQFHTAATSTPAAIAASAATTTVTATTLSRSQRPASNTDQQNQISGPASHQERQATELFQIQH
jgi:hypothetical protein